MPLSEPPKYPPLFSSLRSIKMVPKGNSPCTRQLWKCLFFSLEGYCRYKYAKMFFDKKRASSIRFDDVIIVKQQQVLVNTLANLKKVNTSQPLLDSIKVYTQESQNLHQLKSPPPFQTQIYLVNVPLNVNILKQDLLL